jgi:hypothetical protein
VGVGVVRLGAAETAGRRAPAEDPLPSLGSEWARLDDAAVVWEGSERAARSAGLRLEESDAGLRRDELRLVSQVGRVFEQEHPDVPVILDKGRYLVVRLGEEDAREVAAEDAPCYRLRPLVQGETVFRTVEPPVAPAVPWIEELVAEVSQGTFEEYLTRLTGFPTRHSLSDEFAAAADWLRGELDGLGFATAVEEVSVGSGTSANVVADRPGKAAEPRGQVVVCAHLDSVNTAGGPSAPAPGADDNGSGAAAVLEIGRVLAGHAGEHDLRLILFGGEEQGLFGSLQYVAALPEHERSRIRGVINMDMVACLNASPPAVLLEGAAVSEGLMDDLAAAAGTYTGLAVQRSLNPFASDHVPFIDLGMPAVLTIEGSDRGNGNVHTADDTLAHIDYGLGLDIVRMNVATAAAGLGCVTG